MTPASATEIAQQPQSIATPATLLHLGLPKGRMQEGVLALLADAGMRVSLSSRAYRPRIDLPGLEVKLLKPQNILEMLDAGSRDLGFAGADWASELSANAVEVLDTGLDPVRLVAAAPRQIVEGAGGVLPARTLVVASEYRQIAARWIAKRGQGDRFVRSYGATEVFPPEDADCILDVTATGSTLEANGLVIVEELLRSSTRLFASRRAMDDPAKRAAIDDFAMLLRGVLDARKRVMLELNVPAAKMEAVIGVLPCMRRPTISPLAGEGGFAVKAAVPRESLARLIPLLKSRGGSDIVITSLNQVVP